MARPQVPATRAAATPKDAAPATATSTTPAGIATTAPTQSMPDYDLAAAGVDAGGSTRAQAPQQPVEQKPAPPLAGETTNLRMFLHVRKGAPAKVLSVGQVPGRAREEDPPPPGATGGYRILSNDRAVTVRFIDNPFVHRAYLPCGEGGHHDHREGDAYVTVEIPQTTLQRAIDQKLRIQFFLIAPTAKADLRQLQVNAALFDQLAAQKQLTVELEVDPDNLARELQAARARNAARPRR